MILLKDKSYDIFFNIQTFYTDGSFNYTMYGNDNLTIEQVAVALNLNLTTIIPDKEPDGFGDGSYIKANMESKEVLEDLGYFGVVNNDWFYCSPKPVNQGLARICLIDPDIKQIDCSFEKNMRFTTAGVIHWNGKVSRQKNYKLPTAYKFTVNGLSTPDVLFFQKVLNNIGNNQNWVVIGDFEFPFDSESGKYQVAISSDQPELDDAFSEYSVSFFVSEVLND